ncbi:DUF1684 domain-containing protein [Nibrella viscosa]|uniref:DUF1684 domain-containing protein n=1 Tax=Nibrella viscosa TaxID=1084524 RepID=A0ABP8KW84_9BACT
MKWLYGMLLTGWALAANAQTNRMAYEEEIARHRADYKAEFLTSANGPLKNAQDLANLQFFEPDSTFRIEAVVRRTPESEPFNMPTYNGQQKPHVRYAVLTFTHKGQVLQLALFRSLQLMKLPQYRDYLFLPFKDATNGSETYGGGRYLDFRVGDIKDGKLIIDFNKAYNPYCAYSDGYSCPIPPAQNVLPIPIRAGEKNFGKAH